LLFSCAVAAAPPMLPVFREREKEDFFKKKNHSCFL
jgi:hypothetical protein